MLIGIPKESLHGETRVAATPDTVTKLIKLGFEVAVQSAAGAAASFDDAAYEAAETFAAGGDISVHDVMIASQKANLTMQMALQMRNRLVTAYNELRNISM